MIRRYLIIGIIALVGLSACVSSCKKGIPEANLRQPKIGDLGGVKVSIPSYMAELIEYEGDLGWDAEKWKTFKFPERTYDSKITSFGFDIRFPDGAVPSTEILSKDRFEQNKNIRKTMWMSVGVNSGNIFYRDGLNNMAKHVQYPNLNYPFDNYERLLKSEYGLTVYALKGVDPMTGNPYRKDRNAKDVFLYQDKNKNTQTIITCYNYNSPNTVAPCEHRFTLLDQKINTEIYVIYRREMLIHWQEIERIVKQRIQTIEVSK